MDNVIFAHKQRLLDVAAQLKRIHKTGSTRISHSLGPGYKLRTVIPVAAQRTLGSTFPTLKVTSQVATSGAESALCPMVIPSPTLPEAHKMNTWQRNTVNFVLLAMWMTVLPSDIQRVTPPLTTIVHDSTIVLLVG